MHRRIDKDEALQLLGNGWMMSRNRRAPVVVLNPKNLDDWQGASLSDYELSELIAEGRVKEVPGPSPLSDAYWIDYELVTPE
jgi:hypothetical protein